LYAGAVASLRYSDPAIIHSIARGETDRQQSPFDFAAVDSEPYFTDIRDNPQHFVEQLGLFRVKLGYVATGYLLWRMGLPILFSLRLITTFAFVAVGLTLLSWTHEPLLSAGLLLTTPILNISRMVTADPLSTATIFLAMYLLTTDRNLLVANLLLCSIVVRPDNLFLAVPFLIWMVLQKRLTFASTSVFVTLSLAAAMLVSRIAHVYRWRVVLQHGFIKPEIEPVSHPVQISISNYLHALTELRAAPYTSLTTWALVTVVAWRILPSRSIFCELFPLVGICILLRLVSFPNPDDRFFAWAYLLAGTALIQTIQVRATMNSDETWLD